MYTYRPYIAVELRAAPEASDGERPRHHALPLESFLVALVLAVTFTPAADALGAVNEVGVLLQLITPERRGTPGLISPSDRRSGAQHLLAGVHAVPSHVLLAISRRGVYLRKERRLF